MAVLKYCTKCGHLVSVKAPKCPGCGTAHYTVDKPKPWRFRRLAAATWLLVGLLVFLLWALPHPPDKGTPTTEATTTTSETKPPPQMCRAIAHMVSELATERDRGTTEQEALRAAQITFAGHENAEKWQHIAHQLTQDVWVGVFKDDDANTAYKNAYERCMNE